MNNEKQQANIFRFNWLNIKKSKEWGKQLPNESTQSLQSKLRIIKEFQQSSKYQADLNSNRQIYDKSKKTDKEGAQQDKFKDQKIIENTKPLVIQRRIILTTRNSQMGNLISNAKNQNSLLLNFYHKFLRQKRDCDSSKDIKSDNRRFSETIQENRSFKTIQPSPMITEMEEQKIKFPQENKINIRTFKTQVLTDLVKTTKTDSFKKLNINEQFLDKRYSFILNYQKTISPRFPEHYYLPHYNCPSSVVNDLYYFEQNDEVKALQKEDQKTYLLQIFNNSMKANQHISNQVESFRKSYSIFLQKKQISQNQPKHQCQNQHLWDKAYAQNKTIITNINYEFNATKQINIIYSIAFNKHNETIKLIRQEISKSNKQEISVTPNTKTQFRLNKARPQTQEDYRKSTESLEQRFNFKQKNAIDMFYSPKHKCDVKVLGFQTYQFC